MSQLIQEDAATDRASTFAVGRGRSMGSKLVGTGEQMSSDLISYPRVL